MYALSIPEQKKTDKSTVQMKRSKKAPPALNQTDKLDEKKMPINKHVFYGHSHARSEYTATKKDLDNASANTHLTVDSLNRAIGLTSAVKTSISIPIGLTRAIIKTALEPNGGRELSKDVEAWRDWLYRRKEILLMRDMTPNQCRYDMGIKDEKGKEHLDNAIVPYILNSKNGITYGRTWKEEDYTVNFTKAQLEVRNKSTKKTYSSTFLGRVKSWTGKANVYDHMKVCEKHNDIVNANDVDTFNKSKDNFKKLTGDKIANEIINKTDKWLKGPVVKRFFRFTSLMGMDFFASRRNTIIFVRGNRNGPGQNYTGNQAKSITDSEWEHAIDMKYLGDSVKRVPISNNRESTTAFLNKFTPQQRLRQKIRKMRNQRRKKSR